MIARFDPECNTVDVIAAAVYELCLGCCSLSALPRLPWKSPTWEHMVLCALFIFMFSISADADVELLC